MYNMAKLVAEARDYTEAYKRTYGISDLVLLYAIFISHLTYLMNSLTG